MGWRKISEFLAGAVFFVFPCVRRPMHSPIRRWLGLFPCGRIKSKVKLITHGCRVYMCRTKAVLPSRVWVHVPGHLYLYCCRCNLLGAEVQWKFYLYSSLVPFFPLSQRMSCTAATGCQGFHRMNYLEANPLCRWGIENKLQPFQNGNKRSVPGHGVTQRFENLPTSVCPCPSLM